MNFQDPKIFKSGIPPFGVNDIWWDTERHSFGVYTFHRYYWSKNFSCRLYPRYRKLSRFTLAPPTLKTSGMFRDRRVRYPDVNAFAIASAEIRCMSLELRNFRYYRKQWISFGLEPPMHRSRSNWTDKCIPFNNRSLPNFIDVGRHLGEWRP